MSPLAPTSEILLKTVFGEHWRDAWVCWKRSMYGKRVHELRQSDLPEDDDCYFSIALLRRDAVGRTVEGVEAVHAIVIDDVGTKISAEGFKAFSPLKPTWVVQTSKGNYQVGFVVHPGISVDDYRKLRTGMARNPIWGRSDAAMDPVHLYRLPQGTNTKTGWKVT